MVAPADAEDDPSAGEDVGDGEVLGETERMPHGRDVEAAPEAQALRHVGELHADHEDVGEALVALVLEMVLGEPERVVAEVVRGAGDRLGLLEHGGEMLVGVATLVGRSRVLSEVAEVHVPGIERREMADHLEVLRVVGSRQQSSVRYALGPRAVTRTSASSTG